MNPKYNRRLPVILATTTLVALFNLGCPPGGSSKTATPEEPEEAKTTRETDEVRDDPFVPMWIIDNLDGLSAFLRSGKVAIRVETIGEDLCRDRKIERSLDWTTICYGGGDCGEQVVWEASSLATLKDTDFLLIRQKPGFPDTCFAATEWTMTGPPWRAYSGPPVLSCDPNTRPFPQVYWHYEIFLYNSCSEEPTDPHNEEHQISYYDPLVIIDP